MKTKPEFMIRLKGWRCTECGNVVHDKFQPLDCYACQTGGPSVFIAVSIKIGISEITVENIANYDPD